MKAELETDIESVVSEGFLDNRGVKIHYASLGRGPLLLFVHGFPDFWYTWRQQMLALSEHFQTVAIDLRGFNLSDKPAGKKYYQMRYLVSDIAAVARHFNTDSFTLVGHDWGGAIAWATAMAAPDMIDRLVILNSLHPATFRRELQHSSEQQKASQYASVFKMEGAHKNLKIEELVKWVSDPQWKLKYVEALEHSDLEGMLSLYQNFPDLPIVDECPAYPKIKCPVLQMHGLDDPHVLAAGLNETWRWIDNEYTLVTIPGAGHFVQQDAAVIVNKQLKKWLAVCN